MVYGPLTPSPLRVSHLSKFLNIVLQNSWNNKTKTGKNHKNYLHFNIIIITTKQYCLWVYYLDYDKADIMFIIFDRTRWITPVYPQPQCQPRDTIPIGWDIFTGRFKQMQRYGRVKWGNNWENILQILENIKRNIVLYNSIF